MIEIEGREVDRFASQGELRTLLLALKLSVNSVIINQISGKPIILLDDLESELDSTRRERVLTLLDDSPSQVLITGTGGLVPSEQGDKIDSQHTLKAG
jgi:DNA replication and repair protein RecF